MNNNLNHEPVAAQKEAVQRIFEIPSNLLGQNPFIDKAIKNKDLRELVDQNGKVVLLYSFIDKNTLVITQTVEVFNAILAKYLVSKNVR